MRWCTLRHVSSSRKFPTSIAAAYATAVALVVAALTGCATNREVPAPAVTAVLTPSIEHQGNGTSQSVAGPITRAWTQALSAFVDAYPRTATDAQKQAFNEALAPQTPVVTTCDPEDATHCWLGPATARRTWMVLSDGAITQWLPALAQIVSRQRNLRIDFFVLPNCVNSLDREGLLGVGEFGTTAEMVDACVAMHDRALAFARTARPDLVVLAGNAQRVGTSREQVYRAGLLNMIDQLQRRSEVRLLGKTPQWNVIAVDCLNEELSNLPSCFGRATTNSRPISFQKSVAAESKSVFVDTRPWFCRGAICPLFIHDNLATIDGSRVSAAMAVALADVLYENLTSATKG